MRFFKETALYREMLLLEFISSHRNISQSDIAKYIELGSSMVNNYIGDLEDIGYLKREYQSRKVVHYNITPEGIDRKNFLQIRYVKELVSMVKKGQDTVSLFLDTIIDNNFKKVLLYGAGDVAKIMLNMIEMNHMNLEVVGIIDDNENKVGTKLYDIDVISFNDIGKYEYDGIVITSFAFEEKIINKLIDSNYPKNKIIRYFEKE